MPQKLTVMSQFYRREPPARGPPIPAQGGGARGSQLAKLFNLHLRQRDQFTAYQAVRAGPDTSQRAIRLARRQFTVLERFSGFCAQNHFVAWRADPVVHLLYRTTDGPPRI